MRFGTPIDALLLILYSKYKNPIHYYAPVFVFVFLSIQKHTFFYDFFCVML